MSFSAAGGCKRVPVWIVSLLLGQMACSQPVTPVAGGGPTAPSGAGDEALFERAIKQQNDKDHAGAKKSFADLLQRYPNSRHAMAARRGFSSAAIVLGDFRDADATLKSVLREASGDDKRIAANDLQLAASKIGDGAGLIEALAARLSLGDGDRAQLEAQVLQAIDRDLKAPELERLLKEAKSIGLGFAIDLLWLKTAKVAMHIGDFARAKSAAAEAQKGTSPIYVQQATALRDQLAQLDQVKAKAIGVLLPLSGEKKSFGQSALSAIKLALGLENDGPGAGIELVVRDSEGDADKTQRAIDDLANGAHVIAVIGPLFAEESLAAAVRAESYGLPIINLSRRDGIPQIGPNVFRLCLTAKQQSAAIAKLAFDILGMKKFAIFYPNIPLGIELANFFWDEVDARDGEIRAIETFDYDQTTFTAQVKKMVGRYYPEARTDYNQALRDIGELKLKGIRRQQAVEKVLKSLPPVTDFDAIFIPGNAKQVGMIAPALAFEDIVTTQNSEELKKIAKTMGRTQLTPVRLLGTNSWNSPATIKGGEKFVEGAIFVDGFFAQDPDPKVQKFVRQFNEREHNDPSLPDAQAFDAAGIVRAAIEKNPGDRTAMRKLLEDTKAFSGVTGKISFDADGEAQKELIYLTIDNGEIVKFEAPDRG